MAARLSPAAPLHDRLDTFAFAVLTVLCLCWGLNQVAIKVANAGIPPVFQALLRSALACVLIAAWARWRGIRLFVRDDTLAPGVLCGVLFGAEFVALYLGLDQTTASRGVVFLYAMPFFVALGAAIWLPYERLTPTQAVGLVLAFGGVVLGLHDGVDAAPGALLGDLLCLLAALLWALTTLVIKTTALVRAPAERVLFQQLFFSLPILAVAALLFGPVRIVDPAPLVLLALAYQVVIVVAITYLTWFWLIRLYPASQMASFTFLTPLFGVAAGGLLLAEPITPALLVALALVAVGIWLVNRRRD